MGFVAPITAQWIPQPFPTSEFLYKVRFADLQTGWILGENYLYKTTDGGASWIPHKMTTGYGQALHVLSEDVVFHANFDSVLERTTDGGASWSIVDTLQISYFDFDFISPEIGFAGGGFGSPLQPIIRKTADGGSTWTTLASSFTEMEIEGLSFTNESMGWAVSYSGLMFSSDDAGIQWSFQDTVGRTETGFNAPVRDVQFTTPDSGWAVGGLSSFNVIARTADGGSSWTFLPSRGGSWREIQMLNSYVGWVVGARYDPYVMRTINGGESWEPQTFSADSDPPLGLESIFMLDENLGWAVGGSGVYKTTNGGSSAVSVDRSPNPEEFGLAQNYPNPFNPSTVIRFRAAEPGIVTLKVYNTLGQVISILADEYLQPGSYSVEFRADGLPGGIYFYRLSTGSFSQTKRLVLVK